MSDELRAGRELIEFWRRELAEDIVSGKEKHDLCASVRLLEGEIERRGKLNEYVYALAAIVLDPWQAGGEWPFELFPQDVWLLVRATPEQRARAFLKAVGDA
jgi:hypothetical protein